MKKTRLRQCMNIIDTCVEFCEYFLERKNVIINQDMIAVLHDGLIVLLFESEKFEAELSSIKYYSTIENIQYSLQKAIKNNSIDIIEFETIPLMQEYKYLLYFWGEIYPDKKRIKNFMNFEVQKFCGNKYYDYSEEMNEFKYELSVSVLAYNNLEYTKLCVQSILDTLPIEISCELILMNHGSTDDTQLYFEMLDTGNIRKKIIQLYRNNGNFVISRRIIEGKYHITFCNDVIALPHAIENMLRLVQNDDKVAYVVPTTPAVSNLQTIDVDYSTIEEAINFAEQNNIYDEFRHEQRTRLCNPASMIPSKYAFSKTKGIYAGVYQYTAEYRSFGDDKISLLYRRKGLKCILQKDAFCHHFGSVTLKNEISVKEELKFYTRGRELFMEEFKIDPWGIGFCYDNNIFHFLKCNEEAPVNILGINCGIGSNPLKVRETIKEKMHNLNVKIYNVTDNENYYEDLLGVSDHVRKVSTENDIKNAFNGILFNYIIFESNMEKYKMNYLVALLKKRLEVGGYLCVLNTEFDNSHRVESALYSGSVWFIGKNTL